MKICSIYYGGHKKGCWKRLKYFLTDLAADGHEITIVVSALPKDLEQHKNIEIIQIPISEKYVNKWSLLYFIFAASCVVLIKGAVSKYDRFIAFDCHNAVAFALPKFVYGTHLFLFIRGFYWHQDLFQSSFSSVKRLFSLINKFGYGLADRVRFASHANKGDVVREFGLPTGRIRVIMNNIIDTSVYSAAVKIPSPANQYLPQSITVGYLGQIVPRKNVGFLIDAIEQCREKSTKLIIQGEGENRVLLENYVAKLNLEHRVTFRNWDNDVSSFFSSIDVFVLPTHYDDASNSLIEAISAEKIVFASHRGGNIELMLNNEELLFCPIRGVEDLSGRLDRLATDLSYKRDILEHIGKCKEALLFDWIAEMKKAALIKGN